MDTTLEGALSNGPTFHFVACHSEIISKGEELSESDGVTVGKLNTNTHSDINETSQPRSFAEEEAFVLSGSDAVQYEKYHKDLENEVKSQLKPIRIPRISSLNKNLDFQCCFCNHRFLIGDMLDDHLMNVCSSFRNTAENTTTSESPTGSNQKSAQNSKSQRKNGNHWEKKLSSQKLHSKCVTSLEVVPDERTFCCQVCGKVFKDNARLKAHALIHSDICAFKCSFCEKTFRYKSNRNTHEKVHVTLYKCNLCGASFDQRIELEHHLAAHKDQIKIAVVDDLSVVSPNCCPICGKIFRYAHVLRRHVRAAHENEDRPTCDVCGRSFNEKPQLRAHMLVHTDERSHFCDKCGQAFKNKFGLERHLKTHSVKDHPCPVCPKISKSESGLKWHMRVTHTDEEARLKHKCQLCEKRFWFPSGLATHMQTHLSIKRDFYDETLRYKCEFFSRPRNLKIHVLSHTGVTPFKCDVCLRAFKSNQHLKLHAKTHLLPHTCDICLKGYLKERSRDRHRLSHGKEGQKKLSETPVDGVGSSRDCKPSTLIAEHGTECEKWRKELSETPIFGVGSSFDSKTSTLIAEHGTEYEKWSKELSDSPIDGVDSLLDSEPSTSLAEHCFAGFSGDESSSENEADSSFVDNCKKNDK